MKDKERVYIFLIITTVLFIFFSFISLWISLFGYLFTGFLIFIACLEIDGIHFLKTILFWFPALLFDKAEWIFYE